MLGTTLIVVLVLALFGALPRWPHSREWGYYPSGAWGYPFDRFDSPVTRANLNCAPSARNLGFLSSASSSFRGCI
jgi:hypothetical protein